MIQISYANDRRRNDLEKFLTVFDQSHDSGRRGRQNLMLLDEESLPGRFHPLYRCSQKVQETAAIQRTMDIEDEVFLELADKDRHIGDLEDKVKEKDKALEKNQKTLEEQNV